MGRVFLLVILILLLTPSALPAGEEKYEANWASLDRRPMPTWFNEAKFGIFVVWGPYSVPAYVDRGYAEWYRWRMEDKNSDTWKFHVKNYGADFKYEEFAPLFKAEMWDPEFWVDLFVKSGAKYVVTTANYHDGFCLYPSKYDATNRTDQWNSVEVGPKRDLLGELNAAGRKRGLKMGIYYSLYEWFHPLWLTDRDRYVIEKFHPQFKEVVTHYEPAVIFLDGEWEMDDKRWRSEELAAWLYNESPVKDHVVVDDRWGQCRRQHGDYFTSEYGGGNFPPTHPWEENRGIGHSYGYNRNESIYDYDSAEELLRMLSRICGNGGNYLLCVGPTADGRIPVIMQERLLQIGAWLAKNGECIYGSRASPFWPRRFPWGTCTVKPGRIYVHLWGRQEGPIELAGLTNKVKAAYFLADDGRTPLSVVQNDADVTLKLSAHLPAGVGGDAATSSHHAVGADGDPAPSTHDSAGAGWTAAPTALYPRGSVDVIVLEIEGKPVIDRAVRQGRDGALLLHAREALILGSSPVYETGGEKDQIGYWGDPGDSVAWELRIDRPGRFEVFVTYSCNRDCGGSVFDIAVADRQVSGETGKMTDPAQKVTGQIGRLSGETRESGSWSTYRTDRIGLLDLDKAGDYTLFVQPRAEPAWRSMGLQSILLKPV